MQIDINIIVVVVIIVVIVVVVAVVVVVVIVVVSALVMFLYTLNSSYSLCTLPARTPLSYLKMFFIGLRRLPNRRFRYLIASQSMIPDTEALVRVRAEHRYRSSCTISMHDG